MKIKQIIKKYYCKGYEQGLKDAVKLLNNNCNVKGYSGKLKKDY